MAAKLYRVYQDAGNGMAVKTPYVTDGTNLQRMDKGAGEVVKAAEAAAIGCPIYSPQEFSKMNINSISVQNLPPAVLQTEGAQNGMPGVARMETPQQSANQQVHQISITNTELTTETIAIFDALGFVAQAEGIVAPKAGIIFGGTWGVNTYANLKALTLAKSIDYHNLYITNNTSAGAPSTAFFQTGSLFLMRASVNNQTLQRDQVILSNMVQPTDFQTNIRLDTSWRLMVDELQAMVITLATLQQVVITLNIRAYEDTAPMNLYSKADPYRGR